MQRSGKVTELLFDSKYSRRFGLLLDTKCNVPNMNAFESYLVHPTNRVKQDAHKGDLGSAIGLF